MWPFTRTEPVTDEVHDTDDDTPTPEWTVARASDWLRRARRTRDVTCPACDQSVGQRRRKFTATMARTLIAMYNRGGTEFVEIKTVVAGVDREGGDKVKPALWGLIERATEPQLNGVARGWWRLTDLGVEFVTGKVRIPAYLWVYHNEVQAAADELISIGDALGDEFDLGELLHTRMEDAA